MPLDPSSDEAAPASAKIAASAARPVPPPVPRLPAPRPGISGLVCPPGPALVGLAQYLAAMENFPAEISRVPDLLQRPAVILEIGCGTGEAALAIARQNPDLGVIATDCFDFAGPAANGSNYRRVAHAWTQHNLPVQRECPENLVILRAQVDMLQHLPDGALDAVLLINPEPAVGKCCLDFIFTPPISAKIKPSDRQVVIVPYSREMGISTCGGCEFEHDPDWSQGLGYLMGSGKPFHRIQRYQWGVDLRRFSPYSANSTQFDVYAYGAMQGRADAGTATAARQARWRNWCRRLLQW